MSFSLAVLTWEYPPRIVGEMAGYVQRLVEALSNDLDVSVFTFHDAAYSREKVSDGLEVHRVPNPVGPHMNVVTWALSLTTELKRVLSDIYYEGPRDLGLVNVHEWQFVTAAVAARKAFNLPFVLTLHSLEDHRSSDPSSPLSISIRGLEWLGSYESQAIITNSDWMREEVKRIHGVPSSKIHSVRSDSPTWAEETLEVYDKALQGYPSMGG